MSARITSARKEPRVFKYAASLSRGTLTTSESKSSSVSVAGVREETWTAPETSKGRSQGLSMNNRSEGGIKGRTNLASYRQAQSISTPWMNSAASAVFKSWSLCADDSTGKQTGPLAPVMSFARPESTRPGPTSRNRLHTLAMAVTMLIKSTWASTCPTKCFRRAAPGFTSCPVTLEKSRVLRSVRVSGRNFTVSNTSAALEASRE